MRCFALSTIFLSTIIVCAGAGSPLVDYNSQPQAEISPVADSACSQPTRFQCELSEPSSNSIAPGIASSSVGTVPDTTLASSTVEFGPEPTIIQQDISSKRSLTHPDEVIIRLHSSLLVLGAALTGMILVIMVTVSIATVRVMKGLHQLYESMAKLKEDVRLHSEFVLLNLPHNGPYGCDLRGFPSKPLAIQTSRSMDLRAQHMPWV
ncbi:hypothetical protein BJ138DRAFT_1156834, partial [Hygrophoropsis aurantiaca]